MVKGKGKQKGKNNKGKGKGKPVFPKGKSKGKSSDKGKGKSNSSGKGYGDGSKNPSKNTYAGKVDYNSCAYCGKPGHWAKDCHKKKADMQVRQVEEGDSKDTVINSGTAAASTSAVRVVQIFEPPMEFPYVGGFDGVLTAIEL